MRENRLRWFEHVQRKTLHTLVKRNESIVMEGKRSGERLSITWEKQIKNNLHKLHLSKDLARDRGIKHLIHVLDN